jgi:hypothetical protein
MTRMWGSSAKDVYVVGHNDQNRGQMYHYDGINWKPVKLAVSEGGNIVGATDLSDIYGFGTNNIYAVGEELYWDPIAQKLTDSSLIIQYDGAKWEKISVNRNRYLQTIWGSSPNNIWSGGWYDAIYRYNGISWRQDSVPMLKSPERFWQVNSIGGNGNGELFAMGSSKITTSADEILYCMVYDNGFWKVIDTFLNNGLTVHRWGSSKVWGRSDGKIFSVGLGVFEYESGMWIKLFSSDTYLSGIAGNSSDLFVCGDLGKISHYNGKDWHLFEQFHFPNIVYTDTWTDGKDVFVVGHIAGGYKTLIFHGK